MLFVKLLGAVRHYLQVLLQRLLANQRVHIALLLLARVVLQVLNVRLMRLSQLGAHLLPEILQAVSRLVLPLLNLPIKLVHVFPHLIYHFLLQLAILHLALDGVDRVILLKRRHRIVLFDPNGYILHLELILALFPFALQRFLTDCLDLVFQVDDHLPVLLLSVDVVFLLGNLGLLQLMLLLQSLNVYLIVFLI